MKYKISQKYCWYDDYSMIVKMYFINEIPFTFDELEEPYPNDENILREADKNPYYTPEDLYRYSFYLIDEECHPCLFDLDLQNPECMPKDIEE